MREKEVRSSRKFCIHLVKLQSNLNPSWSNINDRCVRIQCIRNSTDLPYYFSRYLFLEGLIHWNINPVNVKIYFFENRITRFYRSSTGSKNGDMYGNYGLIDGYRHFKVARNMLANGKEGCILLDFPNRHTATYPFESLQPLSDRNPSLVWFLMTAVRIFVCDKSSSYRLATTTIYEWKGNIAGMYENRRELRDLSRWRV